MKQIVRCTFVYVVLISCLCLTLEAVMAQASSETRVSHREDVAGKDGTAPPKKDIFDELGFLIPGPYHIRLEQDDTKN